MEVIRVDRKKHKEIQELFVQEPRQFSPKWKPGQLVTSASRVYKFLEKAGAEPELLHDFVKVCELAEIPYVYIVTGQEDH